MKKYQIVDTFAEIEEIMKGAAFAEAVGCVDQTAACLRALPVEKILATQAAHMTNQAYIDGTVLPTTYAESFKAGTFNKVTLINGNTRDEWRWAVGFVENGSGKPMTADAYPAALSGYYGETLAEKVARAYPLTEYDTPSEAFGAAVTDSLFACTGRAANRWIAAHMPVYAYEFADRTAPSYLEPTSFPLGAAHTYELPYLFEGYHGGAGLPTKLNAYQEKLSDEMVGYWAEAGNAAGRESKWSRYDPARDNYLTLLPPQSEMRSGLFAKTHKCGFWDESGIY